MTYIIRGRALNGGIWYLKGWDKKKPVWISESKYLKGGIVQEYARLDRLGEYIQRIRENDGRKWKSLIVVEVH